MLYSGCDDIGSAAAHERVDVQLGLNRGGQRGLPLVALNLTLFKVQSQIRVMRFHRLRKPQPPENSVSPQNSTGADMACVLKKAI